MLDGKSAFDVVVHANLIRRLYQIGISDQSLLMIQNLYQNAATCIKWNGHLSEPFLVEQGVRQGGAISADLYKVYVNPLLNLLCETGLGGKIGNINCCAPTCADDVAIIATNPLEIQSLVDIAVDFSRREGYLLQPTKSVILPVRTTTKTIETEEGFWNMDDKPMPKKNSVLLTVEENIKKARRTLYSLMGSGLHGTNGLDPETILTLVKTYVLPILTYGLEILIPKGKSLTTLNLYHKKLLKQLLSLSTNTADPAIYILSGMIPIEAELHIKILTLFGTISRSEKTSNEWRIAERQLKLKSFNSNSWFIDIKKICLLYNIENIEKYLDNPLTKSKWKSFIDNKVQSYWTNKILDDSKMYSTLQYMNCQYTIGKIHPLITTKTANNRDIVRIPSRTKIATGTYIFQSNRASFNKNKVNPTCKLCNKSPETLSHFLLTCESLEMVRKRLVDIIIDMGSELLAKSYFAEEVDLIQLIANPFYYTVNKCNNEIVQNIAGQLERVCRQLINNLHMKRYDLLIKQQKCEKKNNLS
ncbi:Hypothetical predicted protein [Mytilus galloprovincialis]|uniref:Reverse transcriptase domain-containing protein n=1 Tax=Mytilus galloprovincialis TaxID=29158 RepID=A0A8B6E3K5_MYTGA|nr:Hypothetical predicted protein [Mytilus galloprovincialis]